jgi:isopropylmalate/homocitrate/citramalate synthase
MDSGGKMAAEQERPAWKADRQRVFTDAEVTEMRAALEEFRTPGAYEPGRWMVSEFNRDPAVVGTDFPAAVSLRDITLRTVEQMGISLSLDQRLKVIEALAGAGVSEIVVSAFRRGHTAEEMRREAEFAHSVNPDTKLCYGGANTPDDIKMAAEAGYDSVQLWIGPFLGKAVPAIAGAVYHRAWTGRDWHNLNFPAGPEDQFGKLEQLGQAAAECGVEVSIILALLTYARQPYIEAFAKAAVATGASDVTFGDHASALSPEGWAHISRAAAAAAPGLRIGVHSHDMFGLATACAFAGARGGASVLEVSVNGLTEGPAQADLAETACGLEALYGVSTGVTLENLTSISHVVAGITGEPVRTLQPLVGPEVFDVGATGDEYAQEFKVDELFHFAITPQTVGNARHLGVSATTGPFTVWDKLDELGIEATHDQVAQIHARCKAEAIKRKTLLPDAVVAEIASAVTGQEIGAS